jgi:transposase
VSTSLVMDTNKERRRHRLWPESLKREIVAATLMPGSSVSLVAQRYDVNANQVSSMVGIDRWALYAGL